MSKLVRESVKIWMNENIKKFQNWGVQVPPGIDKYSKIITFLDHLEYVNMFMDFSHNIEKLSQ